MGVFLVLGFSKLSQILFLLTQAKWGVIFLFFSFNKINNSLFLPNRFIRLYLFINFNETYLSNVRFEFLDMIYDIFLYYILEFHLFNSVDYIEKTQIF